MGLYCVGLYLAFQGELGSMRRIIGSKVELPELVKRYPALKNNQGYKKVDELRLLYEASVKGRDTAAANFLKIKHPQYFKIEHMKAQGRKFPLNPVFGNLEVAEKDFAAYASAIKDFARSIQKLLPIP